MRDTKRDTVARAVAARERGLSRIQTTTAAVGFAGLVATGTMALTLPGSAHSSATSSSGSSSAGGSSGSGSSGSGASHSGTSSSPASGSLGSPSSAPSSSSGSSHATSGAS
jgi:hypothetical protein